MTEEDRAPSLGLHLVHLIVHMSLTLRVRPSWKMYPPRFHPGQAWSGTKAQDKGFLHNLEHPPPRVPFLRNSFSRAALSWDYNLKLLDEFTIFTVISMCATHCSVTMSALRASLLLNHTVESLNVVQGGDRGSVIVFPATTGGHVYWSLGFRPLHASLCPYGDLYLTALLSREAHTAPSCC